MDSKRNGIFRQVQRVNMIRATIWAMTTVSILVTSCSSAEFHGVGASSTSDPGLGTGGMVEKQDGQVTINKSSGNKAGGSVVQDPKQVGLLRPQRTNFGLGCETDSTIVFAPSAVPQGRFEAKITGEFCKRTSSDLYILFVVDNSASMGRHAADDGLMDHPGNDPQVMIGSRPTCGRMRGAKAVIRKFQEPQFAGIRTRIGVMSFASDIISTGEIKTSSSSLDDQIVTEKPFCETVIQDASYAQLGGITVPGIGPSTNFAAALVKAREILENVEGQKLIYFITDGDPTVPESSEVGTNAAFEAVEALRASVKDLTINALFLKAKNPNKAKTLLGKITADPTRVLLADSPDDIARKIIEFPPFGFVGDSAKAVVEVAGMPATTLGVELMRHPTKDGIWMYKVAPFVLQGKPGEIIDHRVMVSAEGLDGSQYRSTVKVNYQVPQ